MATTGRSGSDPLERYQRKRDFEVTPEPRAVRGKRVKQLSFVIQKHAATRLHYDLRLELDGVLLSWAVPKGPSFDPAQKRLAIHVEDHPVSYASFEGTIPAKQYGAGNVIVWDRGTWEPVGDPRATLEKGKLEFRLHGQKLAGLWELVRIRKRGERQDPWLLFKKKDEWARPRAQYDVITALPDSVLAKPLGLLEDRVAATGRRFARPAKRVSPQALPGAVKAALPAKLAPQLATLAKSVPSDGDWLYEIKFDGYRILARIDGGRVRLITRGGHDWTAKMVPLARAVEGLGLQSAWLDGEIVVLDEAGTPSFHALQNAFDSARSEGIQYFLFDAPYFGGYDLRTVPLRDRRSFLSQVLEGKTREAVRFSAEFPGDAESVLRSACELKLEGIIAKRADAPYVSARTVTWLKLKCSASQEFIIGGYTDRAGTSSEVGSLLLGLHRDDGKLVFAGGVGTGWSSKAAKELKARLKKLEVAKSPFAPDGPARKGRWSRRSAGAEHWVKPQLVAQVAFSSWTPDGLVRHASFQGLTDDKPAKAVTRERASTVGSATQAERARGNSIRGVKVSNPDRVIDPSTGLRKLDLVRYYESVAEWMLPHLSSRPVTLVRGPTGVGGELFFQKHGDKLDIPGIEKLDPGVWPGHQALLEITSAEGLVGAAQMNAIEFHTWNSTTRKIDNPDRIVFDLDPGEGVSWARLREAALLTRTILTEVGLESWLKSSGGKGLHLVVPLAPRLDYDSVKSFSLSVVEHLARTIPSRFVAKSGPANRIGKVFVDYIRNARGATTAAAFSARARPGLGVSMPVSWDQLSSLKSGAHWTIATAREYLSFQKVDPWARYWAARQTLTGALKALARKPPNRSRRA